MSGLVTRSAVAGFWFGGGIMAAIIGRILYTVTANHRWNQLRKL